MAEMISQTSSLGNLIFGLLLGSAAEYMRYKNFDMSSTKW
jgi:hypothetical protein